MLMCELDKYIAMPGSWNLLEKYKINPRDLPDDENLGNNSMS